MLVIRGGVVIDGTGAPARRADVSVEGGRIHAVGAIERSRGEKTVDGSGLAVVPGFIDMHSHADFTLPSFPGAINSITQGVTSEVIGNCGFSPAPVSEDPRRARELRDLGTPFGPHLDWGWRSYGEFLNRLDAARPRVNCIPLVGHSALRVAVMGSGGRAATPLEVGAMGRLLAACIADGAWGLSTGLVYAPGTFAAPDEISGLADVLGEHRAFYASHVRDEGDGFPAAVEEAVRLSSDRRLRVHVSHLKWIGPRHVGGIRQILDRLDALRAVGARVTWDAYPYTAGSTVLSNLLPPWVHDGGTESLLERLGQPSIRQRIRDALNDPNPSWPSHIAHAGWDGITIAATGDRSLSDTEGKTIAELARAAGREPADVVLDLLVHDRARTTMLIELLDMDDVRAVMAHPSTVFGSDQLGVATDTARVHPRAYGTFARILGRFVRDERLISVEDAVRRMTGFPASILGLKDRGLVRPGMTADLVLVDLVTVADLATKAAPTVPATGVVGVLVGGGWAVRDSTVSDEHLGRVLRRPKRRNVRS